MISMSNVSLTYKEGTLALENINLQINQGDLILITGPSGSGKTSLLKLMMGIENPTRGSVMINGETLNKTKYKAISKTRRNIGPVFQEFRLIKGKTALENVMLGMRFYGYDTSVIKNASKDCLEKVGLSKKENIYIENLSWGENQRVAIARAVARNPDYIIADEPTGSLDQENSIKILDLLMSFKSEKTAVIITTHATHLISELKDATFMKLDKGKMSMESR